MKKLLEDIVRPDKEDFGQIQNVPERQTLSHEIISKSSTLQNISSSISQKKHRFSPKIIFWLLVFVLLIWGIITFLHTIREAKITITPLTQKFTLSGNAFDAHKDDIEGNLHYDIITIKNDEEGSITGVPNTANVSAKAVGNVTVSNSDTKNKFIVAKGTIFVDSNQSEYISTKSVTISKAVIVKSEVIPSLVKIPIISSLAGSMYNNDSTNLSFKSPTQDKILVSNAKLSGGKDAGGYVVTGENLDSAYSQLRESLKEKLYIQAKVQLPTGYLIFKDGATYTIDQAKQSLSGKDAQIPIILNGEASFVIFKIKNLEKIIAHSVGVDDDVNTFSIPKLDQLKVEAVSINSTDSATVKITGEGMIVWKINDLQIKHAIAGVLKNNLKTILSSIKSVSDISVSISPFWEQYLPNKNNRITILVNNPID